MKMKRNETNIRILSFTIFFITGLLLMSTVIPFWFYALFMPSWIFINFLEMDEK